MLVGEEKRGGGGGMDVDIKNPSIQMDIYMPKPIHRYIERNQDLIHPKARFPNISKSYSHFIALGGNLVGHVLRMP